MTIKNKNGEDYRLKKPNPLMKNQDNWTSFTVYNMEMNGSVVEKLAKLVLEKTHLVIGETEIISSKKLGKKEVISINNKPNLPPTEMPLPTLPPPDFSRVVAPVNSLMEEVQARNIKKPSKIHPKLEKMPRNIINCLLAKIEEKVDRLYEDKTFKIRYSKEVSFEAVILDESDFQFVFWTHLDDITRKSVVYPMNRDKRWWKIDEIKKSPEGIFCSCTPSDIQPTFRK